MDPKNGEISRAMRNRGIEINLLGGEILSRDSLSLLHSRGVPTEVAESMMAFHNEVLDSGTLPENSLTLRDLLQWGSLTMEQLHRGLPLLSSVKLAMQQSYYRHCTTSDAQSELQSRFTTHFAKISGKFHFISTGLKNNNRFNFCSENLFFFFSGLESSYSLNSMEATLERQITPLEETLRRVDNIDETRREKYCV